MQPPGNEGQDNQPQAIDLFQQLYGDLKGIAESHMRDQRANHTLQPTALVNEAYLKIMKSSKASYWNDRNHFLRTVAGAMRQILIDSARSRASQKRGGGYIRVELDDNDVVQLAPQHDILSLHEALLKYENLHPDKAELVLLRYFAGLTLDEVAEVLSISRATAYNYWNFSRAWLQREMLSHK